MLKLALEPHGGFSFENCQRNASLERVLPGLRVPHARKTGTTIAGLVFRDGVILGADTRATNDSVVADKSCEKIHFIAPKIYCCGAGVAADAEMTTRMVASNMELHALSTGREPRVATVTRVLRQTLFRYRGHVGASLIVGGVDVTGPQLYDVHPHGSYSRLPFTALGERFRPFPTNPIPATLVSHLFLGRGAMQLTSEAPLLPAGSGQDAALAVLEDRFQPNMMLEAAQELLVEAITAGILGDLGSGGNVDACVITRTGAKLLRTLSSPTEPVERPGHYRFVPGTTAVLTQAVKPLNLELLEETVQAMEVE
ncbi:proteasome subunit beta type-10 isoform X1 [Cynocephalus volans]|uniref:proteasome subunit beta type-10 isoform X1 n=1 Tax=Cynocephalus volans TaxID=110931 RepID=UPI002FCA8B8B